jgi:hypothetical protein
MSRSVIVLVAAAILGLAGMAWLALREDEATPRPDADEASLESGAASRRGEMPEIPPAPPDLVEVLLDRLASEGDVLHESELMPLAGTEEAVDRLLAFLRSGGDPDKKAVVLQVLASSRFERAQDAVVGAARGESGPELRAAGILALALADEDRAVPVLEEIANHDTDLFLAGTAYQSLVYRGTAGSQSTLLDSYLSAPGERRRMLIYRAMAGDPVGDGPEALESVRRISLERSTFVVPHPELIERYQEFLDRAAGEREPAVAVAAAVALSRMPGPGTAEAYARAFEGAPQEVRVVLVAQLDPRQSASHYERLLDLAPGLENDEVRNLIATRLDECEDPEVVAELREWRDREQDEKIRDRVGAAIDRLEQMK